MKKYFFLTLIALALTSFSVSTAMNITDIYGDQDGLGLGLSADQVFDFNAVTAGIGEEGFTDTWVYNGQSWTQSYSLGTGLTITSAELEIFTGGQGYPDGFLTELYIDGVFIDTLTDGDTSPIGVPNNNFTRLDVFDLMPFLNLLDGENTFSTIHGSGDGWALDYSKITIEVVPEPSTFILLGGGLAGLALVVRRRKKT